MAFEQVTTVLGCPKSYRVHPAAKRYTLKDNGFSETKSGNFQFHRQLDGTPQSDQGYKLKITIDKDLSSLKMSITTANGLKAVDLFKKETDTMSRDKFYFLISGLIDREVLAEA